MTATGRLMAITRIADYRNNCRSVAYFVCPTDLGTS